MNIDPKIEVSCFKILSWRVIKVQMHDKYIKSTANVFGGLQKINLLKTLQFYLNDHDVHSLKLKQTWNILIKQNLLNLRKGGCVELQIHSF